MRRYPARSSRPRCALLVAAFLVRLVLRGRGASTAEQHYAADDHERDDGGEDRFRCGLGQHDQEDSEREITEEHGHPDDPDGDGERAEQAGYHGGQIDARPAQGDEHEPRYNPYGDARQNRDQRVPEWGNDGVQPGEDAEDEPGESADHGPLQGTPHDSRDVQNGRPARDVRHRDEAELGRAEKDRYPSKYPGYDDLPDIEAEDRIPPTAPGISRHDLLLLPITTKPAIIYTERMYLHAQRRNATAAA